MAYTYEQFEREARKTGLLDQFDKKDLVIAQANPEYGISMLQLMKNRNGAKTSEQKILADEAVRQLRQNYSGYTTGGRLPEYADEVIQQTDNYYAGQSAYRRQLAKAGGYDSYEYDENLGSIYSRQSDLERERTRENALASASAATGGVPSSYALMLAQQSGNEVDAQLDEVILGLRQNAYQQALKDAADRFATRPTSPNEPPKEEPEGEEPEDPVEKPEDSKTVVDNLKQSVANAVQTAVHRVGKDSGLDKVVDFGKAFGSAVKKAWTAPRPKKTSKTETLAKSIDGNLTIWKMQGLSKLQLREKILGYLNNDGYVGDLTDGEWAWLVDYYKDYELI